MIHIVKQKTGYMVVNLSKNGEVLKTSEKLNSKASCWKNIKAEIRDCYRAHYVYIQDDTLKIQLVYTFDSDGIKSKSLLPVHEKYVPGINTKRKSKK